MTDLTSPDVLALIDALIQYIVLPAAAILWSHNRRINRIDAEILRILTVLEERATARTQDLEVQERATKALNEAVQRMTERIDRFIEQGAGR